MESNAVFSTKEYKTVGKRPIRHDGYEKVTGKALYGADIYPIGLLHAKVLRSPHAHARIRSIDTSQAEAHPALDAFLAGAQSSGKRCVLVVTGKGGVRGVDTETGLERPTGVLKDMVPRWLNQPPNRGRVVAISEAQPKDGGTGALYVRVKKKRTNKGDGIFN